MLRDFVLAVLATGAGVFLGWVLRQRLRPAAPAPPVRSSAATVSDPPELAWIARSNGALGAWLRRSERGVITDVVEPGLPDGVRQAIANRLGGLATPEGRSEVERLDEGSLVIVAGDDLQAAMLVPLRQATAQPLRDLEQLVGVLRTRAMLETAALKSPTAQESVSSIAIRLALEIEKLLDAEVAVALRRPRGAQVVGTSLRADPHLHRLIAVPGSAVDLAVRGEVQGLVMAYDPLGVLPPDRRLRERRAFLYPIAGTDAPVGALVVWLPGGGEPTGPQRAQLENAARRAGPRLDEAIHRLELTEQAVRDPLTGLRNRRGLNDAMSLLGVSHGVLALVDLDHFKALNDSLGHPAGDAALQAIAAVIEDAIRGEDVAARVGGEEFAIWLPDRALSDGLAVAERLRNQIGALNWSWQGRVWPLSASFGVAGWPETSRSRENLFTQADAALYAAKAAGRNRVERATGS